MQDLLTKLALGNPLKFSGNDIHDFNVLLNFLTTQYVNLENKFKSVALSVGKTLQEAIEKYVKLEENNNQLIKELNLAKKELAKHGIDSDTGLLTKESFYKNAKTFIEEHHGEDIQIGFIDMDGLKKINDTHGHQTGDEVIFKIADAIKTTLPPTSIIARRSGDEFIFTFHGKKTKLESYIARIRAKLENDTIEKSGEAIKAEFSYGISSTIYEEEDENGNIETKKEFNLKNLLAIAEKIMYEEKDKKNELTPDVFIESILEIKKDEINEEHKNILTDIFTNDVLQSLRRQWCRNVERN